MAVNNLAEQCYIPTYGPLENMSMLTKMDMVKVQMKHLCWYFQSVQLICLGLFCWWFDSRSTFWTRWRRRRGRRRSWSRGLRSRVGRPWRTGGRRDPWKAAQHNSKVQAKLAERVRWWADVEVAALLCCCVQHQLVNSENVKLWPCCVLWWYTVHIKMTRSDVYVFLGWWYKYNINQRFAIHSPISSVVIFCAST